MSEPRGLVSRVGSLVWEVVVKEELGNERGLEEIATQQWVPGVKDLEWGTLREIFTWDKFPRADMTGAQYQKQ